MKRTALKRRTPLRARTPLRTRTQLRVLNRKRRTPTTMQPYAAQGRCEVCPRTITCGHHFVHVARLRAHEVQAARFQMELCVQHHRELHDCGEYRFYVVYGVLDTLTARCGNDERWRKWCAGQAHKHGTEGGA